MIYSAFPGTGKTFASSKSTTIIDAESSNFQWLDATGGTNESTKGTLKIKNPDWPQNYIEYIIEKSKTNTVLIASQPAVLNALDNANVAYTTVAPLSSDKQIYLQRYKKRGNNESFISLMSDNFDNFIKDLHSHTKAHHITLKTTEYLVDIL